LNHVLKTVRRQGSGFEYVGQAAIAAIDSSYHFDLWLDLPEERRASYYHRGQKGTLDHILLPHALFDSAGWSYLNNSFTPFTWNGKLLRNGEPLRWQMKGWGKRRFHVGEGYSDHLPLRMALVRKPFICTASGAAANAIRRPSVASKRGGFESSTEGWVGCGKGIAVVRDSTVAAAGRFSLRLAGAAPLKNTCAGHVVMERDPVNRGRSLTVSFDIKGSGNLSVRIRAGNGKWRYYNGETFTPSGSPRYLPVRFKTWKRVSLLFTSDNPSARDIEIEFRAGKGAPFRLHIDNVAMQ
jgi:hypothetical protein